MQNMQRRDTGDIWSSMTEVFKVVGQCLLVVLGFWLLSGICFGVAEILLKTHNAKFQFHCDWAEYLIDPRYVFKMYVQWWYILINSLRHINTDWALFLPFIAIIGTISGICLVLTRQGYVARLWCILRFRFAGTDDVKKMQLHKNKNMVLGKFLSILLGAKQGDAVLCVGELGAGKTSSISIPSVLRADKSSVLAVDLTGILEENTAGHRAKQGEIVYFNLDSLDDPQNNIFYVRWNPFVRPNLPDKPEEIDVYLERLADYFIEDDQEQNNYWNLTTRDFIKTIFEFWVMKVAQAKANDYFLQRLNNGHTLTKEEKDLLLSYYIQMPKKVTTQAIEALNNDEMVMENYLPIGSWGGSRELWMGREVCFAAIADWLIYNYSKSKDADGNDWQKWLKLLYSESMLFAYGNHIAEEFKKILNFSAKQRQMVFEKTVKPFIIFAEPSIRERTNGNDINIKNIMGVFDEGLGEWRPYTIYSLANTPASKKVNRIFVNEILYYVLHREQGENDFPLLVVLDDVGHNLRLDNLMELIIRRKEINVSPLLLCNSLSLVANTYGRDCMSSMIMNSDYKIIKAADNKRLSQLLDKLATFVLSTTTKVKKNWFRGNKSEVYREADGLHKLAKDFKMCSNFSLDARNKQIVLAKGFYNRPIVAESVFFEEDERFGRLAASPANYTLPLQKVLQKEESELITPKADWIKKDE